MNRGYVKLWRKSLDNELLAHAEAWQLFSYFLLKAAHKPREIVLGNQVVKLCEGDLVVGREALATALNSTVQKIRTNLSLLENLGIITKKSTNKYTLISIVNWHSYQPEQPTDNQQITNKQPTNNQQITTNKELIELRELKEEEFNTPLTPLSGGAGEVEEDSPPCASASPAKKTKHKAVQKPTPEQEFEQALQGYTASLPLQEAFKAYRDMRKAIKKPLTAPALSLAFKKLDSLAATDAEKVAVLEQSTLNSWQSLYELKQDKVTASHVPKAFKSLAQQRLEANIQAGKDFIAGNY